MSADVSAGFNEKPAAVRVKPAVRTVRNDDGAALLDVETGLMYSLNNVASLIWDRLQLSLAPAEITSSIAAEYGLPQAEVADDVGTFVAQLQNLGLICTLPVTMPSNE